jgi:leader peptidase (prepilin peptidase)/N-methyltransferase
VIFLYALLGFVLGAPINALADALPERRVATMPAYLTRRAPPRSRDVAVHLAAAALFALLWAQFESEGAIRLVLVSFYTLVLLLVTVADLEHKLIPNRAIMPAIVIAALASPLHFEERWPLALLGGAIGFVFFYTAFWIGERTIGRGALGFGDVKLATFVGLISGFPEILVGLIVALFAGGAISLLLLVTRRATLRTAIPYGPFIAIGGFYAMVWGGEAIHWYASRF